jgi:hypothetical protein
LSSSFASPFLDSKLFFLLLAPHSPVSVKSKEEEEEEEKEKEGVRKRKLFNEDAA